MALCLLVLVFSFAAKLSWYQPKSTQIRALSSSKMWQHEAKTSAAVMAAPDESGMSIAIQLAAISVLLAVTARATMASVVAWEWLKRDVAFVFQQLRLTRVSLLRAPPIL
jgi:hypothetical protein